VPGQPLRPLPPRTPASLGGKLRYPRAVALLAAGYSCGQVLGPLIVTPLLHDGYRVALLVGSAIEFAAAIGALVLCISLHAQSLVADSQPQPADQLMST